MKVFKFFGELSVLMGLVGMFFFTSPVFALAFSVSWLVLTPFTPNRGEAGYWAATVLFGISFCTLLLWGLISLQMIASI